MRWCALFREESFPGRRQLSVGVGMAMQGESKADAREEKLQGPMRAQHKEREFVRKEMLKEARNKCWETRDAYVECCKGAHACVAPHQDVHAGRKKNPHTPAERACAGRTFSIPFFCRGLFKDLNECLQQ